MRERFQIKYKSVESKITNHFDWSGSVWINEKSYYVLASRNEEGWEHVSVSSLNGRIPSWDVLTKIKECFWEDEEDVIHWIPKKSQYVNIEQTCMHLWKIKDIDMGKCFDKLAEEHK